MGWQEMDIPEMDMDFRVNTKSTPISVETQWDRISHLIRITPEIWIFVDSM